MPLTGQHPFGTQITPESLQHEFAQLTAWEEKYRQLILLGKKLPPLPSDERERAHEISGCENRLWLGWEQAENGQLHFFGDSEGRIVRGLLAILLTGIEGKTRDQLQNSSPLALFDTLGLKAQLSASRNQGLNALEAAVKEAAHAQP
ncbi:cysteine desulfurase sulfur acceptor subunit CsdE [Mangrovibacter plantisponsor]|uniref:Cysteine desulfuration protein SufE n=1 Tax=Mangrovibacter plantisponsor TaxID=451513 RepID=A0A317Q7V8_9ENTR|nr:cysteine desulfurase sulfur acceptor subunit CsdE [Mangrovibacter plantisponsor]PWW12713.1 cysteine desulfuration protein SufE [Mangrovibacter plantisponsor]